MEGWSLNPSREVRREYVGSRRNLVFFLGAASAGVPNRAFAIMKKQSKFIVDFRTFVTLV